MRASEAEPSQGEAIEGRVTILGREVGQLAAHPAVGADRDAFARTALLPVPPDRHLAVAGPLPRARFAGRDPDGQVERLRGQVGHRRTGEVAAASTSRPTLLYVQCACSVYRTLRTIFKARSGRIPVKIAPNCQIGVIARGVARDRSSFQHGLMLNHVCSTVVTNCVQDLRLVKG